MTQSGPALVKTKAFDRIECPAKQTKGLPMPAYLIAEHIITDAAKFEEYRAKLGQ